MPYPRSRSTAPSWRSQAALAESARRPRSCSPSKGATVCIGDLDPVDSPSAYVVDVTSRDSFGAFVDAVIARHGRIDILVNNAGVMPLGDFLSEDDAISRTTFDVNVWGLIHGMRAVMPHMIERGPRTCGQRRVHGGQVGGSGHGGLQRQ